MTEKDSQGVLYTKENNYFIVGTNQNVDNNAESTINSIILPTYFNKIIVKVIGKSSFKHSKTLKSIFISRTIEEIRYDAFSYAENLQTVHFSDNSKLKDIGIGAFYCTNMTSIVIPRSVISFSINCFGKTRIDTIYFCGIPKSINTSIFGTESGTVYSFPNNIYVNNMFPFSSFGESKGITKTDACNFDQHSCNINRRTMPIFAQTFIVLIHAHS